MWRMGCMSGYRHVLEFGHTKQSPARLVCITTRTAWHQQNRHTTCGRPRITPRNCQTVQTCDKLIWSNGEFKIFILNVAGVHIVNVGIRIIGQKETHQESDALSLSLWLHSSWSSIWWPRQRCHDDVAFLSAQLHCSVTTSTATTADAVHALRQMTQFKNVIREPRASGRGKARRCLTKDHHSGVRLCFTTEWNVKVVCRLNKGGYQEVRIGFGGI